MSHVYFYLCLDKLRNSSNTSLFSVMTVIRSCGRESSDPVYHVKPEENEKTMQSRKYIRGDQEFLERGKLVSGVTVLFGKE